MPNLLLRRVRFALVVLPAVALFVSCGRMDRPLAPGARGGGAPERGVQPNETSGQLGPYIPGHAIVALRPGASLAAFLARHQLAQQTSLTMNGTTYRLVYRNVPPLSVDIQPECAADPDVLTCLLHSRMWAPEAEAEPMVFDDTNGIYSGGNYHGQSVLAAMHCADAHALSQGSGVKVAILDTGADRYHPAWGDLGTGGNDYSVMPPYPTSLEVVGGGVDEDGDGYTDEAVGHGTHVAGIVKLVAPQATLIYYRVLDDDGWGTAFGVMAAITDAVRSRGVHVINLSLGLTEPNQLVDDAIQWALSQGVAVVATAGNTGSNAAQFPGAIPGVICVGATDAVGVKAGFSNWHSSVDICAPGVGIVSTLPNELFTDDYGTGSGTSMAAPFVSGAIALVKAQRPSLTATQCAAIVLANATSISGFPGNAPYAGGLGAGWVDLLAPLLAP